MSCREVLDGNLSHSLSFILPVSCDCGVHVFAEQEKWFAKKN